MRIELAEPNDFPALRDYFLRLGAVVHAEGATLDVQFADGALDDDESPELYFRTWARHHGVEARVETPSIRISPASPLANVLSTSASGKPSLRLGDLLVSKALITPDQLARALVESRHTGEPLGRVLIRHGSVFESELARVLAEQWSIPYVNLAVVGVDRAALRLLPRDVGLRYAAVPVRFVGEELRVAFADPSDPDSVAAVQARLSSPIQPAIAEFSDIDAVWRSVPA